MRIIFHSVLIAALTLPLLALPAQPQTPTAQNQTVPPATSENARDVLTRVRPAVIQIKGFFGSNTAQAFHGTGFCAR